LEISYSIRLHGKIYKYCRRMVFMVFTEIKQRKGKRYFYRVKSVRIKDKVSKERIYLGVDLSKDNLMKKEEEADKKFKAIKRSEALINLKETIAIIKKVLKKNKVRKAGIFGSYVRGEEKKNSDIDIIIEPPKGIGYGFFGIEIELEKELKKKVDLVSYNGLSPYLKEEILNSEVRII